MLLRRVVALSGGQTAVHDIGFQAARADPLDETGNVVRTFPAIPADVSACARAFYATGSAGGSRFRLGAGRSRPHYRGLLGQHIFFVQLVARSHVPTVRSLRLFRVRVGGPCKRPGAYSALGKAQARRVRVFDFRAGLAHQLQRLDRSAFDQRPLAFRSRPPRTAPCGSGHMPGSGRRVRRSPGPETGVGTHPEFPDHPMGEGGRNEYHFHPGFDEYRARFGVRVRLDNPQRGADGKPVITALGVDPVDRTEVWAAIGDARWFASIAAGAGEGFVLSPAHRRRLRCTFRRSPGSRPKSPAGRCRSLGHLRRFPRPDEGFRSRHRGANSTVCIQSHPSLSDRACSQAASISCCPAHPRKLLRSSNLALRCGD